MEHNKSDFLPLIAPKKGIALCGGESAFYFGALYVFSRDPTLQSLETALNEGRLEDAFLHAHTLKGLCAQLALPALQAKAAALCDLLREPNVSSAKCARSSLPMLLSLYQRTLAAIAALTAQES